METVTKLVEFTHRGVDLFASVAPVSEEQGFLWYECYLAGSSIRIAEFTDIDWGDSDPQSRLDAAEVIHGHREAIDRVTFPWERLGISRQEFITGVKPEFISTESGTLVEATAWGMGLSGIVIRAEYPYSAVRWCGGHVQWVHNSYIKLQG